MQNFGKIKNAFNGILAESIVTKNNANKALFKKYVKTIKESDILKTQFLVYDNIENMLEDDPMTIDIFIRENISVLQKFKPSDILRENKKLISLSKDIEGKLDEVYESRISSLHESLSNVVFTRVTPMNVHEVAKNIGNVINYIKSNKPKELTEVINLPSSMLSTMMVDKYNEKYSELDESERKVLKALINSTDTEKKEVYTLTIRECIDLIDEKLNGADLDAKDKLLRVKDKLLNRLFLGLFNPSGDVGCEAAGSSGLS